MDMLSKVVEAAVAGIPADIDTALALNEAYTADELADAADCVRRERMGNRIDTCSIINARSGRCSEDCKWCAQSRFYNTGAAEYDIVPTAEVMSMVDHHTRCGVGRFSLVTSGRRVTHEQIDRFCDLFRRCRKVSDIGLCASMGLLDRASLAKLKEAGVTRYHCNLETAASYFGNLCTTHTRQDKLDTIRAAREVGMEVCSGGIIGMGETMRQRLELAREAREAGATSIPLNLLNPIPGTPLEGTPLLGEEEIIRSAALMRLVAPDCAIRFAGGRRRLSDEATRRLLTGGVNGALVGDMLTTVGNGIEEDFAMFQQVGYDTAPLGTLYLLPSAMSDAPVDRVIPQENVRTIRSLRHFIVENERTARRWLKRVDRSIDIDLMHFSVLDEHTSREDVAQMLAPLLRGESIGVVSEAGCPAVADPGASAVAEAHRLGAKVVPMVGPSSIIMSIMASGMNGQRFTFLGYLPVDKSERAAAIKEIQRQVSRSNTTQVFIETPYRNNRLIDELAHQLPGDMQLCVAADLTGSGESIVSRPLSAWRDAKYDYDKTPAIFVVGNNS